MLTLCRTRRHTEVELYGAKGSVSCPGLLMSSEAAPLPIEQENQWVPGQDSANEEVPIVVGIR